MSHPLDETGKTIEQRCDDMERTIEEMLGRTLYGDSRPAYRNMATGKLSFPVLSPREMAEKHHT